MPPSNDWTQFIGPISQLAETGISYGVQQAAAKKAAEEERSQIARVVAADKIAVDAQAQAAFSEETRAPSANADRARAVLAQGAQIAAAANLTPGARAARVEAAQRAATDVIAALRTARLQNAVPGVLPHKAEAWSALLTAISPSSGALAPAAPSQPFLSRRVAGLPVGAWIGIGVGGAGLVALLVGLARAKAAAQ